MSTKSTFDLKFGPTFVCACKKWMRKCKFPMMGIGQRNSYPIKRDFFPIRFFVNIILYHGQDPDPEMFL